MRERKKQGTKLRAKDDSSTRLTNVEAKRSAKLLPRSGLLDEPHGVADGLFGGVVIEIVLRQGQGDLADLVRGHHLLAVACFAWNE